MDQRRPVSVIVSPPAFDLDPYESFDEDFLRRTVDEILSDQASFENSFDEYSGDRMMDGSCERRGTGSSGVKKSPYFSSPSKLDRRRFSVAHRVIRKMESTDEDESGDGDEDEDDSEALDGQFYDGQSGSTLRKQKEAPQSVAAKIKLEALEAQGLGVGGDVRTEELASGAHASTAIDVDDDGDLQEVSEEGYVFASVGEREHDRLVGVIAGHPFMRKCAYPVKRSARRKFVRDVRREAVASGMDGGSLGVLVKWIKKIYLEVCKVSGVDKEGSEFGDEIDDERVVDERSPGESKRERKRKRTSVEQTRETTRGCKKRSLIMTDSHSMTPTKHNARIVIDVDSGDSAAVISKSSSPDVQVLEKLPVFEPKLQRTPVTHLVKQEATQSGRAKIDQVPVTTPVTPSKRTVNERSVSNKKQSPPMPSGPYPSAKQKNTPGSSTKAGRVTVETPTTPSKQLPNERDISSKKSSPPMPSGQYSVKRKNTNASSVKADQVLVTTPATPSKQLLNERDISSKKSSPPMSSGPYSVKRKNTNASSIKADQVLVTTPATPSNRTVDIRRPSSKKSSPPVSSGPHHLGKKDVKVETPVTPSRRRPLEESISGKKSSPRPMPARPHGNSISYHGSNSKKAEFQASEEHSSRKEFPRNRIASSAADSPILLSHSPKSSDDLTNDAKRRKADRNRRKRQRQKERKKAKMSEAMSEIGQPSAKVDQQETHMASSMMPKQLVEGSPHVRKNVSMEDPFWDMDF
ncbi:hypothetical protein BDV28DRAFT_147641 [Aspergillus coremiiformis]|uniref:Uncharacterized protein n=1 Tax=Aspergillus coremiiformis TaxID=138285 RepID=A0A5N6Z879_9EURO|nr:hypothetical protein BDV28DRAFT_147641 [Aspergillus coremiiformis]